MKKVLSLFIVALAMSNSYAQDITDAVRYSTEQLNGTARYRAMSGAFGALGGDLSAISDNPAGAAVFRNSEVSASITSYNNDNDALFFGTTANETDSAFDISQAGALFVFNNTDDSADWKKFTLGFNYSIARNFDNDFFVAGVNPNNSIDQYFLSFANGVPLDLLQLQNGETITDLYAFLGETEGFGAQQAFLGFQAFVLEPADINDPNNTVYTSNAQYTSVDQEYYHATAGGNRKFSFNLATQYKENLYLGLNVNSHVVDFEKFTEISEIGFDQTSLIQEINFRNNLLTTGEGFSFQLGAIAKVNDDLRLGVSYQSPTWYRLTDETRQSIFTFRGDGSGGEIQEIIDPRVINVFERYKLQTPGKITGSIAYVFGKQGLISFDYIRKDFSNAQFRPTSDAFFRDQNNIIEANLKSTSAYRIGGEYRIKNLSLRGGYRFEESPYENELTIGDLTGFSLGLGYNFGSTTLDLAFDQAKQEMNPQLYSVGLTDTALVDNTNTNVTLTVAFKL